MAVNCVVHVISKTLSYQIVRHNHQRTESSYCEMAKTNEEGSDCRSEVIITVLR